MGLIPFVKDRVTLVCFDEDGVIRETLEVEATLSANHKNHATVSKHPVAKGEATTDNVKPDSDSLTLDLFWGNRAVDPILFGVRYARAEFAASETAYEKLNTIYRKAWRVSLKMRLRAYMNMVIEDMSVAETVDDGNSIKVTVQFTEVRTAVASTVPQVKPKTTDLGPKKVSGPTAKAPAAAAPAQSVGAHAADATGLSKSPTGFFNVLLKKPG